MQLARLTEPHEDILAIDLHFVSGSIDGRGHRERLAGANVEFRAVARASNRVIAELAFGERAAVMRADIVDAEVLPADAKQDDDSILNLDQQLAGVGDVSRFGNCNEIR